MHNVGWLKNSAENMYGKIFSKFRKLNNVKSDINIKLIPKIPYLDYTYIIWTMQILYKNINYFINSNNLQDTSKNV